MTSEELQKHRRERDRFLAGSYASPLSEEDQATFTGLEYFPEERRLALQVPFHPTSGTVEVAHSTGSPRRYHLVGRVDVTIGDERFTMTVLDGGDGNPFLPFRDTDAGTYEGGRYVPVEIQDDGTATVDFNLAANPWCAYDEEFACPLPPPECCRSRSGLERRRSDRRRSRSYERDLQIGRSPTVWVRSRRRRSHRVWRNPERRHRRSTIRRSDQTWP